MLGGILAISIYSFTRSMCRKSVRREKGGLWGEYNLKSNLGVRGCTTVLRPGVVGSIPKGPNININLY